MTERISMDARDKENKSSGTIRQVSTKTGAGVSHMGETGSKIMRAMLLQKTIGNQSVRRMIEAVPGREDDSRVSPDIERGIDQARGGGRTMDNSVKPGMENAFGTDFSGVRIHTGAHADALNRSLNAKAFTTGRDIFFKDGHYDPGSSKGRELLAHELTHVVQQNGEGDVMPKLTLGTPGDRYEEEADTVARDVVRREEHTVQKQPEEDEERVQTWKDRR